MPHGRTKSQEDRLRAALRKGYLEGGSLWCWCCPVRGFTMENGLIRRWEHMHERLLRSRGGDPCDEANIVLLCADCHDFIHKNPEWATANNFMESATS